MKVSTVIDLDWLKSATYDDLKQAMRFPDKLAAVNILLATREGATIASEMINDSDYIPVSKRVPSPEEAEQIAADLALAEQQAAEAAATSEADTAAAAQAVADAEAAAKADADRKVVEAAAAAEAVKSKKIIREYQVKDEDGNPIGRPTHLEAWSTDEMLEKMQTAHENATRAFHRLKKQKPTFKPEAVEQKPLTEQEIIQLATDAQNAQEPEKASEAIRKLNEAKQRQLDEAREVVRQQAIALKWMRSHVEDFNPCQANADLIGEYLAENNLEVTYENFELAFMAKESELAPVATKQPPANVTPVAVAPNAPPAAPAVPAPAAVIPAAAAPEAVPVSTPVAQVPQPVVAAPSPTPAAAPIAQPAARRPGVNGSLPPGTLTAVRPSVQQQPQTTTKAEMLKEISKMKPEEFRKKVQTSKEYRDRLVAAGIPVLGQRT